MARAGASYNLSLMLAGLVAALLLATAVQAQVYVGCYLDDSTNRAFDTRTSVSSNSIANCKTRAVAAGSSLYGLQGSYCMYGTSKDPARYGASTGTCDITCPGSSQQKCGSNSPLAFSLYSIPPPPTPPSPPPSPKPPSPRRLSPPPRRVCYSCQGMDTPSCSNSKWYSTGTPTDIAAANGLALNWLVTINPYYIGKETRDISQDGGWTFCLDPPAFGIDGAVPAQPANKDAVETGCTLFHIAAYNENAGDCLEVIGDHAWLQPSGWPSCYTQDDYNAKKAAIAALNTKSGFTCPPCMGGPVYAVGAAICVQK